jgi:hypothetical protein
MVNWTMPLERVQNGSREMPRIAPTVRTKRRTGDTITPAVGSGT